MEQLRQELERTKRMMSKIKDVNDFNSVFKRRLQQFGIEYATRDNKMEALFLEFEEWFDTQLQLRKEN